MSTKKRPPALQVQRLPKINYNFLIPYNLNNFTSLSKTKRISEGELEYIQKYRKALLDYRGYKKIEIFSYEFTLVATIEFGDDLEEKEDIELLDALIHFLQKEEWLVSIEIITPLSINNEPIVHITSGIFKKGTWHSTTEKFLDLHIFMDEEGNEIPRPLNYIHFNLIV